MGHDGENVRFVSFGGQVSDSDVFLCTVLDGGGAQQRAKDVAPATILSRRNGVTSLVNFL